MEPNGFANNNTPEPQTGDKSKASEAAATNRNLREMNDWYMRHRELARQAKINRWLWISIAALCIIAGVQTYFLLERAGRWNSDDTANLIRNDTLTQSLPLKDWDPFAEFQKMQKRMDQLHDGWPDIKSFSFGGPLPQQLDLKEASNGYVITLKLPGLDKTNINVTIDEQTLKITGGMEQPEENAAQDGTPQYRRSSHFEQYLTLPGPVKVESLQTSYAGHTLTIKVDKA